MTSSTKPHRSRLRRALFTTAVAALLSMTLTAGAAPAPTQRFRDTQNPRLGERFGASISIDGTRALIGEPGARDAFDTPYGSVSLWEKSNGWTQTALIYSPSAVVTGWPLLDDVWGFGTSVALTGDTAAVVANGHLWGDPNLVEPGAKGGVFVYQRTGGNWGLQQVLLSGPASEYKGASVTSQGDTVVVGLPQANAGAGEARVFVRAGGVWSQSHLLAPPGLAAGDRFGTAVSLHADRLLVGAPANTDVVFQGAVYPYVRSGNDWTELVVIRGVPRGFGSSIAQSGPDAVVGAPAGDDAAVFVYRWGNPTNGDPHQWFIFREIPSPRPDAVGFGASVSIASGRDIVVGAPLARVAYQFSPSGVFSFEYGLVAVLRGAGPGDPWERFGAAVAIGPAGILVADPEEDWGGVGDESGWVYSFPSCAGTGPASTLIHDEVEPALGGPGVASGQVHDANCAGVRRAEALLAEK